MTLDPTAELITENINVEDRHFQVKLNISEAIKGKKSEHGSDSARKYILHKHAAYRHLCVFALSNLATTMLMLLAHCYAVAKVFWVIARWLVQYSLMKNFATVKKYVLLSINCV